MKNKIRNTKIAEILLDSLLAGPLTMLDMLAAMRLGKRATVRKMSEFETYPDKKPSQKLVKNLKEARYEYIRYHAFLRRLKDQGLVTQTGGARSKYWSITLSGKHLLEKFRKQSAVLNGAITPGGTTIISYDIPERIHAERDSMRELLKLFGFTFVHQSLWYANATVEKKFVDYLRDRNLLEYVHIFQVTKSGTLESVNK